MTSILSAYRDSQEAFEKEFGCKKNGDTYFSEYVYDTIIKPHSRTLTLSILRAVRERSEKIDQYGDDYYVINAQDLDSAISAIESEK
jgi:hypothetical protein